MKITDMKAALDQLGKGHDGKELKVWLPGSRIRLNNSLMLNGGDILVEGNVEPGSALEGEASHLARFDGLREALADLVLQYDQHGRPLKVEAKRGAPVRAITVGLGLAIDRLRPFLERI